MNRETPHVHHRLRLPFFLVCFASGTLLALGGAVTGYAGLVVPGVIVAVASLPPIWVILRGDGDPWWLRSSRPAISDRAGRLKFALVLVSSVGFVLVGGALVVLGVARNRPDLVFIGAASCLFFGACAWIALAALRGAI